MCRYVSYSLWSSQRCPAVARDWPGTRELAGSELHGIDPPPVLPLRPLVPPSPPQHLPERAGGNSELVGAGSSLWPGDPWGRCAHKKDKGETELESIHKEKQHPVSWEGVFLLMSGSSPAFCSLLLADLSWLGAAAIGFPHWNTQMFIYWPWTGALEPFLGVGGARSELSLFFTPECVHGQKETVSVQLICFSLHSKCIANIWVLIKECFIK